MERRGVRTQAGRRPDAVCAHRRNGPHRFKGQSGRRDAEGADRPNWEEERARLATPGLGSALLFWRKPTGRRVRRVCALCVPAPAPPRTNPQESLGKRTMKDQTRDQLECTRPRVVPVSAVNFCLAQLYADRLHRCGDEVVRNLTFEELIGALLLARDAVEAEW
jgi:hypothetical protein